MQAFGIFEGGGAKGLAHVGALKAIENRVQFIGVSGSSAGAIIAALVAVGYTADELFDPLENPTGLLNVNYTKDLFEIKDWTLWKKFELDFKATFCGASLLVAWGQTISFWFRNRKIIQHLQKRHGVFQSTKLQDWINKLLRDKLLADGFIDETIKIINFSHIAMPLKIVATNVESQRIFLFSIDATPNESVAKAVTASASLPFFFAPIKDDKGLLLDGGLLSNFPAWNFDKERRKTGPLIPTLGFRLVSELPDDSSCSNSFLGKLLFTVLQGDELLEVREVENLHSIPLRVTAGTTAFDMDDKSKIALYEQGKASTISFLQDVYGPKDPDEMREVLEFSRKQMLEAIGRPESTHMRVNIVWKTTKNTLRVTYSFNMENDADDQLEFELGGGACGECWERQDIVVCDLNAAKNTYNSSWKMNKYQQALVRTDLKSLLCVPIFIFDTNTPDNLQIVGVLNFDSMEDLRIEFENEDLYLFFAEIAGYVSECLVEDT